MGKRKVAVYVDGFNLYHSLRNLKINQYKWLNLRKLSEFYIDASKEQVDKVYYFSAIATHLKDPSSEIRHNTYIEFLSHFGVEFISGHFKKKKLNCPLSECNRKQILKHEEKETDVNIAIHILRDAFLNKYNKQIIITNDTDILPAIKMAKEVNPNGHLTILTPPTLEPHKSLWQICSQRKPIRILESNIKQSKLPNELVLSNGKIIRIPKEYM